MASNQTFLPNRGLNSYSPMNNFYYDDNQACSNESVSMFDQLQSSSPNILQANPMYYQQQQQFQQQAKRKKTLSVKSKNFQNNSPLSSRLSSQNNLDANTTYDSSTDVTLSSVITEPNASLATNNNNGSYINGLNMYPIEHLDIGSFKLKPCPQNTQHNHKQCPFYHNSKDRKRPGNFYSSDLCEFAENPDNCPNGDMCPKAHNRVEQLYKPEKYKTKFCGHYPQNLHLCEYGTFCSFSHNEHDIIIDLIHNFEYDDDFYMFHFKTVWCPFNLTQHDKALCVYAHNWQDYRRKPHISTYEPLPCPNWKSTDFIVSYEDGCPLKDKCTKCHGWKELEYHPLNYKTKHCPSKSCTKGRDCPHYHHMRERRAITTTIANRIFKLVPRNRIVTGTFKQRKEDLASSLKYRQHSFSDTNTSLDAGTSLPTGLGNVGELPSKEQLNWMNSMIQNMMVAHGMGENKQRGFTIETKKEDYKRRNSVDSPYFGDKKKPEPTDMSNNPHIHSLFGRSDPRTPREGRDIYRPEQQIQQDQQQHPEMKEEPQNLQEDQMFRAIINSPMKKFCSRSVQNLDDPRPHPMDSPMYAHQYEMDSDLREGLEKMIDSDEN